MTESSNKLLGPDVKQVDTQAEVAVTADEVKPEDKLSKEDLDRVEKYLSSPIHQVERKPFRPWLMMLMLVVVMTLFSGLSLLIARLVVD